jgi:hypothetical protein
LLKYLRKIRNKYITVDNAVDVGVDVALVLFNVTPSPILIVMRVIRWLLNEFVLNYIKIFIKYVLRLFIKNL